MSFKVMSVSYILKLMCFRYLLTLTSLFIVLLLYSVNRIILVIFMYIISCDLVVMYRSDRSIRFPVDDILFQSGDICNKVTKWRS